MTAATRGNWNALRSSPIILGLSKNQRRKAKSEVSAANEGADEAGEPDMFGGVGSVAAE